MSLFFVLFPHFNWYETKSFYFFVWKNVRMSFTVIKKIEAWRQNRLQKKEYRKAFA